MYLQLYFHFDLNDLYFHFHIGYIFPHVLCVLSLPVAGVFLSASVYSSAGASVLGYKSKLPNKREQINNNQGKLD